MQLPLYLIYNPPTFMSLSKDMVKVAASFSYWHLTMHTAYSTPSDLEEDNDTDLNLTNPPRPSKMDVNVFSSFFWLMDSFITSLN